MTNARPLTIADILERMLAEYRGQRLDAELQGKLIFNILNIIVTWGRS